MSVNPIAAPFVQGLADGLIRYQACTDCRAAQTLARYACRACGSARLMPRISRIKLESWWNSSGIPKKSNRIFRAGAYALRAFRDCLGP